VPLLKLTALPCRNTRSGRHRSVSENCPGRHAATGERLIMLDEAKKFAEQKAAEASIAGFAKNSGRSVAYHKEIWMPMVFTDAKTSGNPIIFANDSFISQQANRCNELYHCDKRQII